MKKSILAGLALSVLVFAMSCHKNPTNYWYFEGVTYTVDDISISNNTIVEAFNNYSQNYLSFTFSTVPSSSGSYRVVGHDYPAANEVYLSYGNVNSMTVYNSTGNDSTFAKVTVSGGKLSIALAGSRILAYGDSANVSGHISQ